MSLYICSQCGYGTASWLGRCPQCEQWNTLKKQELTPTESINKNKEMFIITKPSQIKPLTKNRLSTKIYEFDRVLGGGFIPGSVILLTGEPGIGKSTLTLQMLNNFKTLYVSAEESIEQIKNRLDRLKINPKDLDLSNNHQIETIINGIKNSQKKYQVLVIDSIQTVYSRHLDNPIGSLNQLKETINQLINLAKKNNIVIIVIGHITKSGEIAGPKTLEHLVDVVLSFEGEKISNFRILRTYKNRFGSTDEIGIFEMTSEGLNPINNPLVFLDQKMKNAPGMSVVGITEGKRPLFFEIQTLIVNSILPIPRRVVKGIDYNKFLLLLAVLRKYFHFPFDKYDIYLNVIGGVKINSTAAELGIISALISSLKNKPLPKNSLFIGEIGLLGEVRKVFFEEKIIKEAKRLGFKNIYSSKNIQSITEFKKII